MKTLFKKLGIVLVFFCFLFCAKINVYAQDVHFSQFYANPLHLNPAMAGAIVCPRINLNFRNQWPSISNAYVSYSASYDQHVEMISGGIGILAIADRQGGGTLNTTQISGMYSFRFELFRDFFVKPAIQATYFQRSLDWDKLRFPDQIDPRFGFVFNTDEPIPENLKSSYMDFSAGILGHSKNFYIGFAANHLNRPYEGILTKSNDSRLPMKYTAHVGANISFAGPFTRRRSNDEDLFFSPNILYMQQGDFKQLNYGLYINLYPFVGGLWVRQNFEHPDAIIILLGIQQGFFKFGYSYDLTISRLGPSSGGAHEFSLIFLLECPKRKKKIVPIQCPTF